MRCVFCRAYRSKPGHRLLSAGCTLLSTVRAQSALRAGAVAHGHYYSTRRARVCQGVFTNFSQKNGGGGRGVGGSARPCLSFLFCPPSPKGKDSPPPPSPTGKGEIFSFFMQGASPLASPRLSRKRHGLNLRSKYPGGGACPLGRRLACHRYTRRGGANKAGTLKIHRAADRRQAAGRSSRAEYSEVPGIVGPLSGSDGSFFVILPDCRSSFYGEKRPPGRPGQAPQSHRRWRCRIRTCYPFRR